MASYYDDYFYDERQKQTFKSLCYVKSSDGSGIVRLADVAGNELRSFNKDQNRPQKFDNREVLYNKDSHFPVGFWGIIEWTVGPNNNDPRNDYVNPVRKSQDTPILIVSRKSFQSVNFIKDKLKEGIKVSATGDFDILFACFNTRACCH